MRDAAAMQQIVLNAELHTILPTLTEDVLIVDTNGKRVGAFITAEHMIPPITEEELRRRKSTPGKSLTTAELLQMLEQS
jgi:hypothetical protein